MTIALQYCNITVNDVDESIAFYGGALGLDVLNDVSSGDYRWVTLGSDSQPGLGIVLSEPHAGRSQADGDVLQELLTKGVLPIILLSSVVGAVIGSVWLATKGRDRATPIPFGPYLAIAGWVVFFWGEQMIDAYLKFAGLR